nr:homocysteine S-methyltransferase family protein [uncultured Shinella sp.]
MALEHPSFTILDGGMGRLLERLGAPFRLPEWSALSQIEAPDYVTRAHQAYVESGADIITTNSYGLVPHMLGEERFSTDGRALADRAGRLARAVADAAGRRVLVAGSLPPPFESYRPERFQAGEAPRISESLVPACGRMSISG